LLFEKVTNLEKSILIQYPQCIGISEHDLEKDPIEKLKNWLLETRSQCKTDSDEYLLEKNYKEAFIYTFKREVLENVFRTLVGFEKETGR